MSALIIAAQIFGLVLTAIFFIGGLKLAVDKSTDGTDRLVGLVGSFLSLWGFIAIVQTV